jgi:hypothetical protein
VANENGNGGQLDRLLSEIEVVSFTASPSDIVPFETTTLSWSVKLPTGLRGVGFIVAGQTSYAITGSVVAEPLSDTDYHLTADFQGVRLQIAVVRVNVNEAACKQGGFPSVDITSPIQEAVTKQFPQSNGFTLDGVAVQVPSNNVIEIDISANGNTAIVVPIELGMQGTPPDATVSTQVGSVKANISVSAKESLETLGCANFCADHTQPVIEFFVKIIAGITVAPVIAAGINSLIQEYISLIPRDPRRPYLVRYALTSVALTSEDFTFTVCPSSGLPSTVTTDV